MRIAGFLALGLLVAIPAIAQGGAADTRHQIAPDNNWSINDADCMIDAGWDGDIEIAVNRHIDHHDLVVSDPALKNVVPEKVITVRYGAAGKIVGAGDYRALGYRDGKIRSYAIEADDALLEAFATTNSFAFYRGKTLEIELDMTGFAGALAAMRACESKLPAEPMDQTMSLDEGKMLTADDETAASAAEAAAAAAATTPEKP